MDLDKEIAGLRMFKQRLEKLFDGGALAKLEDFVRRAEGAIGGADGTATEDVKAHLDEVAETVAGIQQQLEKLPETITGALNDALAANGQLAAVQKLADPAVLDLLDWLARNREAIDVLLSLGEAVDGETEAPEIAGGTAGGGTAGTGTAGTGTAGTGGAGTGGSAGGGVEGSAIVGNAQAGS